VYVCIALDILVLSVTVSEDITHLGGFVRRVEDGAEEITGVDTACLTEHAHRVECGFRCLGRLLSEFRLSVKGMANAEVGEQIAGLKERGREQDRAFCGHPVEFGRGYCFRR
jgi:hypothetical protein